MSAPLKTQLCSVVRDAMSAEKLRDLQNDIRNGNTIAYRRGFTSLLREILGQFHEVVAERLSLPEETVLVSYHASSVILSGWIRVTQGRHVWERTTFAQTEIDTFREIYNWDTRPGHLMTDPRGPIDIDVVFCRRNALTDRPCITPQAWRLSRKLLHSVLFPVLVEHELDGVKPNDFAMAAKCVQASREINLDETEFDELATLAQLLKSSGIWSDTQFREMPVFFLVRSFLVTFFYTIGRCAMPDASAGSPLVVKDGANFERIIAHGVLPEAVSLVSNGSEKLGSLALVTSHKQQHALSYNVTYAIREACEFLAKSLRCFELDAAASTTHVRTTLPDEEDRIRGACAVDWEDDPSNPDEILADRLASLTSPLHTQLEEQVPKCGFISSSLLAELRGAAPDTAGASATKGIANLLRGVFVNNGEVECEDIENSECNDLKALAPRVKEEVARWRDIRDKAFHAFTKQFKIVGASRLYLDLLKRLQAAVAQSETNDPQVVFLQSEPGCGKENIAKLIHLFSERNHAGRLMRHFHDVLPQAPDEDWDLLWRIMETRACQCDTDTMLLDVPERKPVKKGPVTLSTRWGQTRLFNYFALNMATLHSHQSFTGALFGEYSKDNDRSSAGRCLLAHLLGGTVFLDEFNTLPEPKWANCFLRLFEQPYEMDIQGRAAGPIVNSNLLMICASSLSGEELVRRGFNEAVVYRLTRRSFTIPPLRDRRVDIAVFVNAALRRQNGRIDPDTGRRIAPSARIQKVNRNAMELLCELPWPDNYRGLQALLSEVREARHLSSMTAQELSFKEVVDALRRRETLLAATRRPSTDSQPAVLKIVH